MLCGIYLITNQLNGKKYIGKSRNIERRWWHHKNAATNPKINSCPKLYHAFRKYGIDNFSFEILEQFPLDIDESILGEREKYWINYYHSNLSGYNIGSGGEGGNFTPETRKKAFEAACKVAREKYDAPTLLEAPEIKEKIKQTMIERYGVDNPMKNPEINKKAVNTKIKNGNTVPVVNIETGEIFPTLNAAAKKYNCRSSNIGEVIKGHRHRCAGFHWRRATQEELEKVI